MNLTIKGQMKEVNFMKFNRKPSILFIVVIFLLSACGGAETETAISEEDVIMTYSVGTIVAGFFATQTAMITPTPVSTNTPIPTNTFFPTPTPFNTPLPATWTPAPVFFTFTPGILLNPTVTGTLPTPTVNSSALGFGCNNLAFVRDVNYPNGTNVAPRESFVKTWKIENTGSCDWQVGYTLSIVNDPYFDSSWNKLGRVVQPGQWAEVSVFVDAPANAGTYSAYWRLTDGANAFGATLGLTVVVVE
jgi:hypothetical protein